MSGGSGASHDDGPVILIPTQGPVGGVRVCVNGIDESAPLTATAYVGIPFAQPPVGSRRWRRAQGPAPSWSREHVRASKWQADPYQPLDLARLAGRLRCDDDRQATNASADEELISEDCLYLNVWVPERRPSTASPAPVLVWIYGGGYTYGATSQPLYDGAKLACVTGCVVVSIAYRVGVFGFLGARILAQTEGKDAGTGNYGLWDVVEGLQWVKKNIGVFGGDADNVTAIGESAGAINIHYLMLSVNVPKGLFARAALLSGTASSVLPRSLPSAQATFDALARQMGAPDTANEEEKRRVLMKASASELQDAYLSLPAVRPRSEYLVNEAKGRPKDRMRHPQSALTLEASSLWGPVWDGVMVDESFFECLRDSTPSDGVMRNGGKGIFFGHTADEGTVFTSGTDSQVGFARSLGLYDADLRAEVESVYDVKHIRTDSAAKAISNALMGDLIFSVPVSYLTSALARQTAVPAYRYVWAHRPSAQLLRAYATSSMMLGFYRSAGAYHSSELPFLFGWDSSELHTLVRQSYPLPQSFHRARLSSQSTDDARPMGFTHEERKLSMSFVRHLAQFAHGDAPWSRINEHHVEAEVDVVPDVPIMLYDEQATLGASTPEAIRLHARHLDEENAHAPIPVHQTTLHQALVWKAPIDPDAHGKAGNLADRYSFWTAKGLSRVLSYHYGDAQMSFVR